MSHTAALGDMFLHHEDDDWSKTNNSGHVFSLRRVVLCKTDATEHVREHGSVYSFTSDNSPTPTQQKSKLL